MTPMFSRAGPFGFLLNILFGGPKFFYAQLIPVPIAGQTPFRPSRLANHRPSRWPFSGGPKFRAVTETIIRFGHGDCRHRRGLGRPLLAT